MEGGAKIKLSCCLLSNAYANRFWKDFWPGLEAILGSNWSSEAPSEANVIKCADEEGPESFYYPPSPTP